jgi:DNA primase
LKRLVYVKECAQVLELEEQVMINETNKAVRQIINKRQQQDQIASSKTHQQLTDELLSLESSPESGLGNLKTDKKPVISNIEFQEKDIARILIASGGELFDKDQNITVAAYILSNIEEVMDDFDNKICEQIAKDCLELLNAKEPITAQYFINHKNPEISAFAIDLIHSPFEFSSGWKEFWDIDLQTQPAPDQNFLKDSISALHRFKLKKIIHMCGKNQERLKEFSEKGDTAKMMKLLKMQQRLLAMRDELAKKLNTVVLK